MAAVLLALAASASWGVSDFLGGLKTRAVPVLTVLAVSQPAGLILLGTIVLARLQPPPDGLPILWAVLAGFGGAIGIGALYQGLAVGSMGIVAPITATSPLIPLTVGLLRGERPSALQLTGIAVALQSAASDDPYWATFILRIASSTLVLVAVTRHPPSPGPAGIWLVLILIGFLDSGATELFAVATTKGLLSVVAVLAALYPVLVAVLARVVLHERLTVVQRSGALAAVAGAAAISAG